MKERIIDDILMRAAIYLSPEQLRKCRDTLTIALHGYRIEQEETALDLPDYTGRDAIAKFFVAKKIQGLSDKTLRYYGSVISRFIAEIGKAVADVNTDDIRYYMAKSQKIRHLSKTSQDNERRILSSFFNWLEDEDFIRKSPVRKIPAIKREKYLKRPFSEEEVERLRDHCKDLRERAVVEVLLSTGMRVGEMELLNMADVDFDASEVTVFGKGQKERVVYLNAKSKHHLKLYLSTRTDNAPGLFISKQPPYRRLEKGSIEVMTRELGARANVEKCHPHRFRRTAATTAIFRGMPIEQVQQMLGHEQIATTTRYAIVNQHNVKVSHGKYLT